jgi:4'-phosphopantetheinyl transferase EntD
VAEPAAGIRVFRKIARCHFTLAAYRDDLFTELAVFFPPSLTRAVPKRRAEFLAGRYLASMALTSLGQPPFTVGIGGQSRTTMAGKRMRFDQP